MVTPPANTGKTNNNKNDVHNKPHTNKAKYKNVKYLRRQQNMVPIKLKLFNKLDNPNKCMAKIQKSQAKHE